MALMRRGALFAGALFAGVLFGPGVPDAAAVDIQVAVGQRSSAVITRERAWVEAIRHDDAEVITILTAMIGELLP